MSMKAGLLVKFVANNMRAEHWHLGDPATCFATAQSGWLLRNVRKEVPAILSFLIHRLLSEAPIAA